MAGSLALVGGGEFRDGCTFDAELLAASGSSHVAILATAAAYESPAKVVARATSWFATLGATVSEIPLYTRVDARDPAVAKAVRDASFVYVTDGSAQHLRSVLLGTPAWDGLVETWQAGGVLAAAGQSATALCDHMVDNRGGAFTVGLGLLSGMTVIPQCDQWSPEKRHRTVRLAAKDLVVAGIDTGAALVRGPAGGWSVWGAGSVTFFQGGVAVGIDALDDR